MVKAKRLLSIINFYGEMFEKEMRDKLGITYYTHEEHYPILEKWMIDHNCHKDDFLFWHSETMD